MICMKEMVTGPLVPALLALEEQPLRAARAVAAARAVREARRILEVLDISSSFTGRGEGGSNRAVG
jgi:hypothetical protein